ncbi:helix-turn-helix domain-containing protein [Chryseobacterium sediminis]|uniref:Helix-turn-helix domain-containing protein n=1 Tax=Chryseobacterium indologenes TaxID=253 RepID=A0A411DH91_CHRID|nr:helix-turn-helix domain-containing protein [Chryseobacterium sediminis]MDR6462658.1 hypothetical protein [Chryseobacterium sediminis]QBA19723.1 helix-turn-helix domain-containing protein [Chryseobacterium indologenes]
MNNLSPDYKLIYQDIISKKYPHKKAKCEDILNKKELSVLDIIRLNSLIFDILHEDTFIFNQRLRSYDRSAILEILNYQKINSLNNTKVAQTFNLSRNTIAKWKKMFIV